MTRAACTTTLSWVGALAAELVLVVGCTGPAATTSPSATARPADAENPPAEVVLHACGLFPESLAWDALHRRFLVTSVTRGVVTVVHDDGSHEPLTDGRDLKSAVGALVDPPRNRLLVAGGDFMATTDPTAAGQAKLAVYDLATGTRTQLVDLGALRSGARHSANDVAVDRDGNAYVTDTLAPVIYKVTPDGTAGVFVTDPRFAATDGLGLNGIEYDPDGVLLVTMVSNRALYRVPLAAPATFTEVTLSEPVVGDALALRPDGRLFAAAPYASSVVELTSQDGWGSATVTSLMRTSVEATTTGMTLRDGVPYALDAHFAEMATTPPTTDFEIRRVPTTS